MPCDDQNIVYSGSCQELWWTRLVQGESPKDFSLKLCQSASPNSYSLPPVGLGWFCKDSKIKPAIGQQLLMSLGQAKMISLYIIIYITS